MKKAGFVLLLFALNLSVFAQTTVRSVEPCDLVHSHWPASWIAPPDVSLTDYGVYHFRKTVNLTAVPEQVNIRVTADNRYRLFVNGEAVCFGPARGDLQHWRYETVDIGPYLNAGKNVLSAVVWNFGEHIPWAQMTRSTGFLLQGPPGMDGLLDTDADWKVIQNHAHEPVPVNPQTLQQFVVVGPGDVVDGAQYPWGWELPDFDDSAWESSRILTNGKPRGVGTDGDWMLVPRSIPMLEQKEERISTVRRADGMRIQSLEFEKGKSLLIPPNSTVSLLLDQTYLTTAYPELLVTGGKGARIRLSYAEALMDADLSKGDRNEIEGRQLVGYEDVFLPDGGAGRLFRPLWFRTWRYIQMDIKTSGNPLTIEDFKSIFTAYPLEENASFVCDDKKLAKIWKVGWRTARLCANETYYDCPYYEQLQYVGDTRIQALVSLYVSGDDRLMRKAIEVYDDSRIPDGLTQSRYPSSSMQIIPPYSLFWIAMIYDYHLYRDDAAFVKSFMPGVRSVLEWHEAHLDSSGLLAGMTWWNFVDWPNEWPWDNEARIGGVPSLDDKGRSSILSLQYAYVLQLTAELMMAFGEHTLADRYLSTADRINQSVYRLCWNESRALLADTPQDQTVFSQHANVLGILTDAIPEAAQKGVVEAILADRSLIQCTLYYRFYLFRAMIKVGLGNRYIEQLKPWSDMLDLGLTTFAERPDPTRSDCHAWSASPNYDFLATVCGILPGEAGFKSVLIRPHPGPLKWIKGEVPHPSGGFIRVNLKRDGKAGIKGDVTLPEGIDGVFVWNGVEEVLKGGLQKIDVH